MRSEVLPMRAHAWTLDSLEAHTAHDSGRYVGRHGGLTLGSAFQPIFSLSHRRPVGYEALMRARNGNGQTVPPPEVFGMAESEGECVFLDRLCRALHVGNFLAEDDGTGWLFLNVNPRVSVHGKRYGSFFRELLERHGLPAHRVVVEILEGEIQDESQLAEAVGYYRELGCLVAIDDFGAGHSNFDRIWGLRPDIVKLDRGLITQAADNAMVRRLLPSLVALIHESGSFALMEGIETEEQALIAMDAGFDFVQGYYFGRPAESVEAKGDLLFGLCDRFRAFADSEARRYRQELEHYEATFEAAAHRIASGQPPDQACRPLLEQPRVERCYILDTAGRQLGTNLSVPHRLRAPDSRFIPLADAAGAVWSRKPYFRRAMAEPGHVQVSRPYLSSAGANMCVTLSILLDTPVGPRIFCLDLDWSLHVSAGG